MGSRALSGLLTAFLLVGIATASIVGCRSADPSSDIDAAWTLEPSPPVVGEPLVARITLTDSAQHPISGAKLHLEGQMSHPGMAPAVSELADRGSGTYEGRLTLTMAGDWILVITGELPGGRRLTKQLDIPGVRPAG